MKSKGFSIIELIVTMGIIAIVSVFVFPHYAVFSRNIFLEEEVNNLAKDIERVRGMSISAKDIDLEKEYSSIEGRRYGIEIKESGYDIFAETGLILEGGDKGEEITPIQSVSFERNIVVFSPEEPVKITFSPPDPMILFNEESKDSVEMKLGYGYEEPEMKIIVNSVGLVKVQRL